MSKKYPTGPEYLRMQRKLEIKKQKTKVEEEQLRWYEANPDHPRTIAFREAAFDAARAHMELEAYKEAKHDRMIKSRLAVAMPAFCACFELEPRHPAGIVPKIYAASVDQTNTGSWRARAKGRRVLAKHVVSHLTNGPSQHSRNDLPANPRRWLAVKLTYSFEGVYAWVMPMSWVLEHYGQYPPLAAFETAGGYVAIFLIHSGVIIESAQTLEAALKKLSKPSRELKRLLILWNTHKIAPTIDQ